MIHVITVAYNRPAALRLLIASFYLQTSPLWDMRVFHDGKLPDSYKELRSDKVKLSGTPVRSENYGHPNRRSALQLIQCDPKDFILLTNDDNYYVPVFVEQMLSTVKEDTGLVFCDTVHSTHDHYNYILHKPILREKGIDIGAFIVRADVAKETGFNYIHRSADGKYCEECIETMNKKGLKAVYIERPLYVHN